MRPTASVFCLLESRASNALKAAGIPLLERRVAQHHRRLQEEAAAEDEGCQDENGVEGARPVGQGRFAPACRSAPRRLSPPGDGSPALAPLAVLELEERL